MSTANNAQSIIDKSKAAGGQLPFTRSNFAVDLLNGTAATNGKSWLRGTYAPTVDFSKGGQFGFMTDIGNYINTTPFVSRDLIPFLMQYPKAYALYPTNIRDDLVRTLKALMEVNAKRIEGLRQTMSLSFVDAEVGGSSQIHQQLSNVKRERSEPSYTWDEVEGCGINRFWEWHIETFGMSADSKYPNIITEIDPSKYTTLLADMTHFVMCYVEPDRTGRFCVDAYLCANMFPMSAGDRESRRELTADKQGREINISFTALTQVGYGVIMLGQYLLNRINYSGANTNHQPPAIDKIDADILAQPHGYADQIHRLGKQAIQL